MRTEQQIEAQINWCNGELRAGKMSGKEYIDKTIELMEEALTNPNISKSKKAKIKVSLKATQKMQQMYKNIGGKK